MLLVLTTLFVGPVVVRAGLGNNAIRLVAKTVVQGEEMDAIALLQSIVTTAILLGAVLSVPVAALILATARPDLAADVPLLGAALFFESLRMTASDLFTGLQMTAWAVAYSFQVRSLVTGGCLLALHIGGVRTSFTELLLVFVAINGVLSVSAMIRMRFIWVTRSGWAPIGRVRRLIRQSVPFFLADIGLFVIGRGDIWVAARILGPTHGPVYGAASTIASQLVIPLSMTNLVFAPLASSLAHQNRWHHVRGLARLMATAGVAATATGFAVILIAGRQVLGLAYGPGYGAGQLFLIVLAVGSIATVAAGPCAFVLLMLGKQHVAMRTALLWGGMAILFLPLGGWAYGGTGLAIASSAMSIGCNLHLAVESWRLVGISTLPYVRPRMIREAWNDLKGELRAPVTT